MSECLLLRPSVCHRRRRQRLYIVRDTCPGLVYETHRLEPRSVVGIPSVRGTTCTPLSVYPQSVRTGSGALVI